MVSQKLIADVLTNPDEALMELDRYECENSLLRFMELGWQSLEPGVEFVPNWGVRAVCDHLEAVTRGDITRLLINVPPGCTKSMTTNVFWPAWEWGPKNLPHYRYINFAHEQNLAIRDNVRCRSLIQDEWYQNLWGDKFGFKKDQNAKVYFENSKTGWRQACAAASLTGRRGDRVIGDDPHSVKGADSDADREAVLQVFSETVPTRLNKQAESAIVVIMQRVHERDVSGLILAKEMGYEHLMLPMEFEEQRRCFSTVPPSYMKPVKEKVYYNPKTFSWQRTPPEKVIEPKVEERYNVDIREEDGDLLDPVRFPRKAVEDLKSAFRAWGGTYAEAGQLQQRPAPRGGGMFRKDDWQYVDKAPEGGMTVRGWDFAASTGKKSPWTVGVKMRLVNGRVYILDVDRRRATPAGVETMLKTNAAKDGHSTTQDMPQDPGQAGKSQKWAIAQLLHGYKISFSPESGSKEDRAKPFAAQVECNNVFLVIADWNDAYVSEGAMFPNGEFMDQIDASSRAYSKLVAGRGVPIPSAPEEIGG